MTTKWGVGATLPKNSPIEQHWFLYRIFTIAEHVRVEISHVVKKNDGRYKIVFAIE